MTDSIAQKTIRGGAWVVGLRGFDRVFQFARLIILARLLTPFDFGILGVAVLALVLFDTFSQFGFRSALIQTRQDVSRFMNSVWSFFVLRSCVIFLILLAAGPTIAVGFNEPEAGLAIQVVAIAILLQGFTNIGVIRLEKELNFRNYFMYQMSGTIIELVVAVSAALIFQNYWALVLGYLVGNAVRMVMSYVVHNYRPKFHFSLGPLKELFGFGKWAFAFTIIVFVVLQGDDIVVGAIAGVAALGIYQMAYKISNLPATEVTNVISQVTFPSYAKLHDQLDKVKQGFIQTLQMTSLITLPFAALVFVLSYEIVFYVLGAQWLLAVPLMKILAVFGANRSLAAGSGPLFLGTNRPKIATRVTLEQMILMVVFIIPMTLWYGVAGAAMTMTFISLAYVYIILKKCNDIIHERRRVYGKIIGLPLVSSLVMLAIVSSVKSVFPATNLLFTVVLGLVGLVLYALCVIVLDKYVFKSGALRLGRYLISKLGV